MVKLAATHFKTGCPLENVSVPSDSNDFKFPAFVLFYIALLYLLLLMLLFVLF